MVGAINTGVFASYLHDESLQTDALVVVLVVAVELKVVVEDEAALHVTRHLQPNCCGT